MIKEIHIFDFDGTLVDSSHRYQLTSEGKIDLKHWFDNSDKVLEDTLLPLVAKYRELLNNPEAYVIIATARVWCELSEKFIKIHDITPQYLIARKSKDDTRKGAKLKIQGVKRLLNLKQFRNVSRFHVYEDNKEYLEELSQAFQAVSHFIPSNQGY
jgi:hydroxymethylpyrimidine pyrophosphatase-like HAD family hydrolase